MNNILKAEQFLLHCIRNGLAHSYDTKTKTWIKPYPEVTGYLLSYFSNKKKIPRVVFHAADTLLRIQHLSGGFSSFFNTNILYTFDTAQIAHGLTSLYLKTHQKKFLQSAIRACDFVLSMQWIDGSFFPMFHKINNHMCVEQELADGSNWGSTFSYIQSKNIEALLLLSKVTKEAKYSTAAKRFATWGKRNTHTMSYSHPFGYFLEGVHAIGEKRYLSNELKEHVIPVERGGFIPYKKGLSYAYTSGSIQLGILLAKAGYNREAKRIYNWAARTQDSEMGGLYQFANKDSSKNELVHCELNSWGTKYFLELAKELQS